MRSGKSIHEYVHKIKEGFALLRLMTKPAVFTEQRVLA
jgi:hypothetical protein